jgi:hypothetical protein
MMKNLVEIMHALSLIAMVEPAYAAFKQTMIMPL